MLPVEIKSGKDYTIHSALDKFLATPEYHINETVVLSNEQKVYTKGKITYLPIYYCMIFENNRSEDAPEMIILDIEMPEMEG